MKLRDLTKEQIIEAIKCSKSLTETLGKLDAVKNGANRKWLRNFISDNKIDISHFVKQQTREEYEASPKLCKNCGKEIDWEHKENDFCSRSCSTSYNNRNREWSEESRRKLSETLQRNNSEFDGTIKPMFLDKIKNKEIKIQSDTEQRICKNCGKVLNRKQMFYCSNECKIEYEQKEYISNWKAGLEDGLKGEYGLSLRIRKYLFGTRGCKCELCGWGEINPYTNTIPLEIHHKDGNYLNNSEENLQVLCPNCHSLTETFKSHNKDGRKGRSKYHNNE